MPNWMLIDHYALNTDWHALLKTQNVRTKVIDELGDRSSVCDIPFDQNLGASAKKYDGKVPKDCRLLMGPNFALLRSELRDWRDRSLKGRIKRDIRNILITMGGACS